MTSMNNNLNNVLFDDHHHVENLDSTLHTIATLIQLNHIVFRISGDNGILKRIVAIYNPEKAELETVQIKELVESYTFPILSNTSDNARIINYFETISQYERDYLRDQKYPDSTRRVMDKIKAQEAKQKRLRDYYKYHKKVEGSQ